MFKRIMAPVDLLHLGILDRALKVAAEEARHHGVPVVYVTVTANTPGPLGHTPEEKQVKLDSFAAEQAEKFGIEASGHLILAHDPRADIDRILTEAADEALEAEAVGGGADIVEEMFASGELAEALGVEQPAEAPQETEQAQGPPAQSPPLQIE